MSGLQVDPILESWLGMLALAGILLGLPLLVRIHGADLTPRRRQVLVGLRLFAGCGLLLLALRPSLVWSDTQPGRATLAVLADRSRSMGMASEDGRTRWAVQGEVARSLSPALSSLDDSLRVKWFTYAETATESPVDSLLDADSPPTGTATDLSAALSAALRSSVGEPLAGVILLGDGVHNPPPVPRGDPNSDREPTGGDPPTGDDPQALARMLGGLDVPLWTVPIGPPGDVDQVRDAEIDQLAESLTVFSENDFSIDFVLRSRALQGIELPVRVWLSPEGRPDERTELAIRSHIPGRATDSVALSIPASVSEPGKYHLEVAVAPQSGEPLLSNNSQFAFLEVRQGGGRVLYVEGQPRPEQTFLKRALRRFPDLDLTYRWVSPTLSQPPAGAVDWFEPGRYDIVVIGDLAATALPTKAWEQLAESVRSGAGLLVLGGLSAFDAGGYGDSPVADSLPIRLRAGTGGRGDQDQLEGPLSPRLTRQHPITTLDGAADNRAAQQAAWDRLPPLLGANRLGEPRVAPGVNVLLETANGEPLLVIGEYGEGRVIAFAGDSTWRWWRRGEAIAHRRFWRQMLLWLIDRVDEDGSEILVELERRRFAAGDTVSWNAVWTDPQAGPEGAPTRTDPPIVEVLREDGTAVPIQPSLVEVEPGTDRRKLSGSLPELDAALYRLRVATADGNLQGEQSFQVFDNDRELAAPFADQVYLTQLSAQTAASGGASFRPDQVDELLERIAELRRTTSSPIAVKYRLADGPASAWPLWLVIVGCLATEWVLRRRWGLV